MQPENSMDSMVSGEEKSYPSDEMTTVWDRIIQIGQVAVLPALGLVLAFGIFTVSELHQVDNRLTGIEANRFTSADGLDLWRQLESKADTDKVPPPEVIQKLTHLEDDIAEIKSLFLKLEQMVLDFHMNGD